MSIGLDVCMTYQYISPRTRTSGGIHRGGTVAELHNAGMGKWPKYCSSERRRPHPRVTTSQLLIVPSGARISHHPIAFLFSSLLHYASFYPFFSWNDSGFISILTQSA